MYVMAYAPYGAEGVVIRVEADIRRGIPGVDVTGLASGAVKEARERVRAAFRNSGFPFPQDRVLVNLAPAGVRKEEAALDLPIALAVMAAAALIPSPKGLMVLGELELSGRLRPVRGVLAAVAAGLKAGLRGFIVPWENGEEAKILAPGKYAAVASLRAAADALALLESSGTFPQSEEPHRGSRTDLPAEFTAGMDFAEVRGQRRYKRALEIAAAGGHNLFVFGPPGAGKTMLARKLSSIMAPLSPQESVEATRLHSLAGLGCHDNGLITAPPFRSPHHSASTEGILGGGRSIRPGEITLAHLGILFLDEAAEFRSDVLKSLREPLEDSVITISRAEGAVRLPADFQLILAANPCPCGRLGVPLSYQGLEARESSTSNSAALCFCSAEEINRYWKRFGAALLDRIELRVPVIPGLGIDEIDESSERIASRVHRAVQIQQNRFVGTTVRRNARMPPRFIERYCIPGTEGLSLLRKASESFGLSGRAYHGILRIARTIADLEASDTIKTCHMEEAVFHRRSGDDPYEVLSLKPGMPSM